MNSTQTLEEFQKTLKELKLLMASFNPDTRLAEIIKQATIAAHKDGELNVKLSTANTLLWVLVVITTLLGTLNLCLMWGLAK